MKCPEIERYLHERLDGKETELPPHGDRHLSNCVSCQALLQAVSRLEAGLQVTTLPSPVPLLSARIVREVHAERRRRYMRRYRLAVAVAAAVALVALPLASVFSPRVATRPPDLSPDQQAKSANKKGNVNNQQPDEPSRTLRFKVEKAGSAVASLTDRLAGQTRLLWQAAAPLSDPMASLPDPSGMGGALNPVEESLRETGSGVSSGLQTVASSTQQAVRFFLREVPDLKRNPKTVQ